MCEPRRRASVGREMLEESVSGLRSTMCELQERLNSVDGEGTHIMLIQVSTSISLNTLSRLKTPPPPPVTFRV